MNDLAGAIRRALTAREVVEHYGFHPNRSGFIQCPFHQGDRHASLKIYEGDRGWYCFGCGAGGSVIDFAMRWLDLPFREACLRLNEDFGLGLSDQKPSRAELTARLKARQEEEEQREQERKQEEAMAAEYRRWWDAKQRFAPAPGSDYIHPLYAEAVKRLPYLEWWLDEHAGRR